MQTKIREEKIAPYYEIMLSVFAKVILEFTHHGTTSLLIGERERERERERENVLRKGERKAKGERTSLAREREKQFLYNFLMIWR